jgi:hypothetical protein
MSPLLVFLRLERTHHSKEADSLHINFMVRNLQKLAKDVANEKASILDQSYR